VSFSNKTHKQNHLSQTAQSIKWKVANDVH